MKLNKNILGLLAVLVSTVSVFAAPTTVVLNTVNGGSDVSSNYTLTAGTTYTSSNGIIATATAGTMAATKGCSIYPALPPGLTMVQVSTTVCQIIGTPTGTSSTTVYDWHMGVFRNISITVGPVANLKYPQSYAVYAAGTPIVNNTPSFVGSVEGGGFSVFPSLPSGLSLNSNTGVISGTPSASSPLTAYTVTALSSGYSATSVLQIQVQSAVDYSSWKYSKSIKIDPTVAALKGPIAAFPLLVRLGQGSGVATPPYSSFDFSQSSSNIASVPAYTAYPSGSTGGADLRFTTSDGKTDLPFQIERWDNSGANKFAEVWVLVPSISNTGTTSINMYWGKSGQSLPAPTAQNGALNVFSTKNGFQAVFHMNANGTGNETDATANGFVAQTGGTISNTAATNFNTVATTAPSSLGLARTLSNNVASSATGVANTNQYFVLTGPGGVGNSANSVLSFPSNSNYTLSAWVKLSGSMSQNQTQRTIIGKSDQDFVLQTTNPNSAGTPPPTFWNFADDQIDTSSQGYYNVQGAVNNANSVGLSWTHIVNVRNAMSDTIWVNGQVEAFQAPNSGQPSFSTNSLARGEGYNISIGARADGGGSSGVTPVAPTPSGSTTSNSRAWPGFIDEVEMSNVARSGDFVRLSFQNERTDGIGNVVTLNATAPVISVQPTASVTALAGTASFSVTASSVGTYQWYKGSTAIIGANASTYSINPVGAGDAASYSCVLTSAADGNGNTASIQTNSVTLTIPTVPGAPTSVTAGVGDASALVSWTAPASNGGGVITSYTVTSNPGAFTCTSNTGTPVTPSCTVVGLTNATGYTFTVKATNAAGQGAASSASATVTPASGLAVPGAPTGVSGTSGSNGQVSVSWTAPVSDGGSTITGYTVTSTPGSFTCTATGATTCIVTGLTNATGYTFVVTATNGVGTSSASTASGTLTPAATVPAIPTAVAATVDNGQAGVSWTAPDNGGATILSYTATASPGGATCTSNTGSPVTPNCIVTGLVNGTAYTFTVKATNSVGNSVASSASSSVTPLGLPGAPTAVTGTTDNLQSVVSWTAPVSNGGSSITGYTVTATPGGATCSTTGATSCTVTGLLNGGASTQNGGGGTVYTFSVVASNSVGVGPNSLPSLSVSPATVPGAPTSVAGTTANGQSVISWTAPANNGSTITGYTVTSTPGNFTCATTLAATVTCTVTGLTNGTPYTFAVIATNGVGTGTSGVSAAVTPTAVAGVPGAPTGVAGTVASAQSVVTWTAPASIGTSAITSYTVTSTPDGKTCSATAPALTCTVSTLVNGVAYTFKVTATNSSGTGVASAASATVTPAGVPSAPTNVLATATGNGRVTISWTAAAANGSAVTGYTATSTPSSLTCTATTSTSCTVIGLVNGTSYTFAVTATNASGTSAASAISGAAVPSAATGIPGAPTTVTGVAATATSIAVSWTAPASTGSTAISSYTVTSNPDGLTCTTPNGSTTTCTVSGLNNGTSYTFSVLATNSNGVGPSSTASSAVVSSVTPAAPTSVTGVLGNNAVTVSWVAPTLTNGTITSYTATAFVGGVATSQTCTTPDGVTLSCIVPGLTNGTAYTFKVTATNANGAGTASAASSAVTPGTALAAPTAVVATPASGTTMSVSWTAPSAVGNLPITNNTVTSSPGGLTNSCATSPCVVSGLTVTTAYTFTVTTTNAAGTSVASAPSASRNSGAPNAPTAVAAAATASSGQLAVSWTNASVNSANSYTATSSPGGLTCTNTTTPCTVTGLTDGVAYTFTVVASNANGAGPASSASATAVSSGVPSAPTSPTATVAAQATGAASVGWTNSASTGGSAISTYTATALVGGVSTGLTCSSLTSPCVISGLTNGTAYTFTVTATNANGVSPASAATSAVTPGTVLAAPTNLTLTPNAATTFQLAWTAPSATGNSPITSYTVTPSTGTCVPSPVTNAFCTTSAITAGTSVTFTVVANNAVGASPASSVSASMKSGAPNAPTAAAAVAVAGSSTSLSVSWTAATQNSPTGNTVTSSPGGFTCSSATSPCTVSGLTAGTPYTFTVAASNAQSFGPASAASTALAPVVALAGAPTSPTATTANAQSQVSWTAPANNGGTAISSYLVTSNPGGLTCTTADGSTTNCIVTGLTNGTSYTFTVNAITSAGVGTSSAATTAVVPGTVLAAPTNVIATPFTNTSQMTVSWTAPSATGNPPITGYTVTGNPAGTCTVSGTATTCNITTGLTANTAYTFTVVATNAAGNSVASSPSVSQKTGAPNAAQGVTASATGVSGSVAVAWTNATLNSATSYTATSSPGGLTCTNTTTPCTITGLTDGTSYTFTVVASNAQGPGPASAASAAFVSGVPGAPTAPLAVPTAVNTSLAVSWTAPALNGGTALSSYTATAVQDNTKSCTTADGSTLTCTVTGLSAATAYTFTVKANNVNGSSVASSASTSVTTGTPGSPTAVSGVVGNASVLVSWTPPANTAGGVITSYTATSTPGSLTCTTGTPITTSCTVSGLTNTTGYTFVVTATSASPDFISRTGLASTASSTVTPSATTIVPGAPTAVTVVPLSGNTTMTLSWTAPTAATGGTPTGYTVASTPSGATCPVTAAAVTCTATGTQGTAYTFQVTATDAAGSGAPSASSIAMAPGAPGAASAVAGTTDNTQSVITWTAPTINAGAITSYTATALVNGVATGQTCSNSVSPCTITGLANGVAYTFTVAATNANGTGPSSAASSPVTPQALPNAPTIGTPTVSAQASGVASVLWTNPSVTAGATSYTVTSSPGGITATCASSPCAVSGLTNGTSYTFTVAANNASGTGPSSAASAAVIPGTVLTAPTGLLITPGSGGTALTLSWTAPTVTGNAPITGYTVVMSPGGTCTAVFPATTCNASGTLAATSYTFTVATVNAVGTGTASASSASQITGAPNAATAVTAAATSVSGSLAVSWTAATLNSATSYTATSSPGGFTCTNATSPCSVTGLTDGTPYTFTVVASNAAGSGPASAASAAFTSGLANAPTGLTGTVASGQSSVSFTASTATGGSTITGYKVTASPGGANATCASSPCLVTGLTNGTGYTFTAVAINSTGNSAASVASPVVIPAAVPGVPTGVAGTTDNTQSVISWTAPVSNGGSPITAYTATSTPGSFTCSTTGALTCTITGLSNATPYTFAVTATNAVGVSSASSSSGTVTPAASAPGAPTAVSATVAAGQSVVSWTAPVSTGGSAITSYTVTSTPGSFTCTSNTGSPVTPNCTVTGLTNGTAYAYSVTATNAVGTGSASTMSASVTPRTVPDAPTAPTATSASSTSLTLSWTAPVGTGGSALTGYTVVMSPAGTCTPSGTATTCTSTGLSNGVSYTFTVAATNAAGTGVASSASTGVAPSAAVPAAPTGITATSANAQSVVAWTAPANNGSAISTYTVTSTPGSLTCTATSPAVTCTVTGLTNGTSYTFAVTATNGVGVGPASAASASVTARTTPDVPTAVTAVVGNGQATVSWTASVSNGGSAITGYTATSTPGSLTCVTTGTSCIVPGLNNGVSYTFAVTATNAAGTSAVSTSSSSVTPLTPAVPAAPTSVAGISGNVSALISWTAPISNGGSVVTGYTVTSNPGSFTCSSTTGSPITPSCLVTGLTNGVAYTFTVTAANSAGSSVPSAASSSVTPNPVAPDAPTLVAGTVANLSSVVSWTAPVNNGGAAITSYTVTSAPGSFTCTSNTGSPVTPSCLVTGLTNGVSYTFTVTATNTAGTGVASAASAAVIPATTAPAAPTAVLGTPHHTFVDLTWTAPADNGGATVTSYTATSTPGSFTCTSNTGSPITPGCKVSGLTDGVSYTFTVTATNSVGTSAASIASATIIPVPAVPFITSQPANATVVQGTAAKFGVVDTGTAPLSYYLERTLGGVTDTVVSHLALSTSTDTLSLPSVVASDSAATYAIRVSNAAGSAVSSSATLKVVTTPVANPPSQSFFGSQNVALTTTAGAAIRYTTDGVTTPTGSSTLYTGTPISMSATTTIKAISILGSLQSSVLTSTYTLSNVGTPAATPAATAFVGSIKVVLNALPSDAVIRYTLNGTTPDTSTSPVFNSVTDTLVISATTTVKAVAVKNGAISSVFTGVYTLNAPPVINTQPHDTTVVTSALSSFTVAASLPLSGGSLSYQWKKNGVNMGDTTNHTSGSTTPTLSFIASTGTVAGDAGSYTVVVTNTVGSTTTTTTSTAGVLTVGTPPTINTQPHDTTVISGAPASFTVGATGSGALTYQWKKNGSNVVPDAHLSGGTAATLAFAGTGAVLADTGIYTVVVTNTVNGVGVTATSTARKLFVVTAPSITTQPHDTTVIAGATANFAVAATVPTGTFGGTLSYQWQKNGVNMGDTTNHTSGSATSQLNFIATTGVVASDTIGSYTVIVKNTINGVVQTTTSTARKLILNPAPVVVTQPHDTTVLSGAGAAFTVSATTAAGALSYQWKKNGNNVVNDAHVSGATAASLVFAGTGAVLADTGSYTVVITNTLNTTVNTTTSTARKLFVVVAPSITTQPTDVTVTSGSTTNFKVVATIPGGTTTIPAGAISYQWKRNGVNMGDTTNHTSGSITTQLNFIASKGALISDTGSYTVVVTNTINSVTNSTTSTVGRLSISVAPPITTQPHDTTVVSGAGASFAVVATPGSGTLSYAWKKNGAAVSDISGHISGSATATLSFSGATSAVIGDTGSYTVVVTNTLNSVTATTTSSAGRLIVNAPPTITTQLRDTTVVPGTIGNFKVVATIPTPTTTTPTGAISYVWKRNGVIVGDTTGHTSVSTTPGTLNFITPTGAVLSDTGIYTVVVTNTLNGTTTQTTSNGTTGRLLVNAPPSITTQPHDTTVVSGSTASFTAAATGGGVLSYQWKRNGVNVVDSATHILGATTATLTFIATKGAVITDTGSYTVVVTNTVGASALTTTSTIGKLIVNAAPTISTQPHDTTVVSGSAASFAVAATSPVGTLSYQWKRNGVNVVDSAAHISGSTTATLSFIATVGAVIADTGSYTVVVTNSLNGTTNITTSSVGKLTVTVPPAIVSNPLSQTASALGVSIKFGVTASGSVPMRYTWIHTHGTISDTLKTDTLSVLTDTLTIASVAVSDSGSYTVVVKNVGGSVTSAAATLVASPPPAIVTGPAAQVAIAGTAAKFAVTVTGGTPLVFKWIHLHASADTSIHTAVSDTLRKDTLSVLTDTLTLASVAVSDTGLYRVVISNGSGFIVSDTARLKVNSPPVITAQPTAVSQDETFNATFIVKASGDAPFTYQWFRTNKNGTVDTLAGATKDTLNLTNLVFATQDSTSYKCKVTNAYGSVTSNNALLRVNKGPVGISSRVIRVTGSGLFNFRLPAYVTGVHMSIMDMRGHIVWVRDFHREKDANAFTWDGVASNGRPVSSGMYVVRMQLMNSDGQSEGTIKKGINLTH